MEKMLHILLIEDDMNTCNRISNYIATKDNMDLAGVTNNCLLYTSPSPRDS